MRAGEFNVPDFDYRFTKFDGEDGNVLLVVDRDLGNMSVTNGIEHVLRTLEPGLNADGGFYYRDSMGQWDEVIHDDDSTFIEYACCSDKKRLALERKWRELTT